MQRRRCHRRRAPFRRTSTNQQVASCCKRQAASLAPAVAVSQDVSPAVAQTLAQALATCSSSLSSCALTATRAAPQRHAASRQQWRRWRRWQQRWQRVVYNSARVARIVCATLAPTTLSPRQQTQQR
jgi:hypothetical protein